ncbi:nucleic acid/nucleotide deaminase domain-containing protein [Streptomyces sp. NPDC002602]|uniref:nucleic acid/nucleotide deaminase domain-containing protein n=1 Tax=Streptomyces sp. NPDC002602 TaxID=3364654 RepID=UPI003675219F
MTLPDDLVEVLDLIGVDWPQIDEDEVKGSAKAFRNLGEGIRDAVKEGNNACSHIVAGKSKGQTVDAIDQRWGRLTTRDLATFAKGCDELAGALDKCAGIIIGCKVAMIAKLTATAATATAGVVGMFFTVGLSGLLSAAAIAAARLLIQEAIDYAVDEITSIVTDEIEAKILAELGKLFTGQLGGGTYDVMAAGNAATAMDLVIEFEEFEAAAGDYQKTAKNFGDKKGEFSGGGIGRKSSVKKDSRFHKLAKVMDTAEDTVEKKADEMVKILEEHGGKIDKSKKDHKNNDHDQKDKYKKCGDGDDDEDVPTYLLNADGSVQRLSLDGGLDSLNDSDKARLDSILNDGKAWVPKTDKEKAEWHTPQGHTDRVKSEKVSTDGYDLAAATQSARKARDDYGGTNYAAGRYVGPDGQESILVAYSSKAGHSERMMGRPLLHNGQEGGLKELFTEREPCKKNPECARWLNAYFDKDLKVTHVADYYTEEGKTTNKQHNAYVNNLKKAHGK